MSINLYTEIPINRNKLFKNYNVGHHKKRLSTELDMSLHSIIGLNIQRRFQSYYYGLKVWFWNWKMHFSCKYVAIIMKWTLFHIFANHHGNLHSMDSFWEVFQTSSGIFSLV